jgi:hypothetical protein
MYFPPSLKQARNDLANNRLPEDILLPNEKKGHFTNKFKYLGSLITPLLNEDCEIEARIKKTKSIMGASKYSSTTKTSTKELNPKYTSLAP